VKISVQPPITPLLSPLGVEGWGDGIGKGGGMAVSAYVLIRVEADKTKSAFEGLTKLKEVKSAHTVTGPFDIILLVEAKNLHELGEVILSKIRGTDGVSRTMTCVTVEKG
jgi:DNA-binding Lrp family transcriptional regulator